MGLAKKSSGTFLSNGVIFILRFPIGILLARFLGPEGKGILYLLITSVAIAAEIAQLGLGPAAIYFISKDRARLPTVVGNLLVFTGVIAIIVTIGGWIFLFYGQADIFSQLPLWIWIVTACLVPLHLLRSLLMQVLSALLRIKEINLVQIAAILLHLLLLVLFVVILDQAVRGAFLAEVLAAVLLVIGFFLVVILSGGRPARPDLALLGASFRFGVKSYPYGLMRHFNLRLDAFLVASLAVGGVGAAGVYSVAAALAELLIFIPESIRLSLLPMVAASSTTEANRLTLTACRHTLLLTWICVVVMAALGPFAITYIYGEQFVGAVIPLWILLPGVGVLALSHLLVGDLTGRGRPEATTIGALCSLMVTIILDLLLIPRYGIIGAAIASTCAYTVECMANIFFFARHSDVHWRDMFALQKSDLRYYVSFFQGVVNLRGS